MSLGEWDKTYSIGIAIFDDEHKKLAAIINRLEQSIVLGTDSQTLQQIADSLVEYTLMHFRHEEMYFDDWAYPDAAEHAAVHAALRQQVFDYRKQIRERDSSELAVDLAVFLRDWLQQHIMIEDRKYGAFLYEKGLR